MAARPAESRNRFPLAGAGLFAGPLAWAFHVEAGYLLTGYACSAGKPVVMHVTTAAAVLIALVGGLLSWRAGQRARGGPDAPPSRQRSRFIALVGTAMAGLFVLAILAQGSASFILTGCEK